MDTDVTQLLQRVAAGDRQAAGDLLPLVYDDLRRLARARMASLPAGQTLQATALVHEAYLRVAQKGEIDWESRRHFFFVAARAMRDLLVEDARRKGSLKRGGDKLRVDFEEALLVEAPADEVLALDLGLDKLEALDPQGHELVMLRYFTGFSLEEVAQVWGVSTRTVERKWRFVKAWLAEAMDT